MSRALEGTSVRHDVIRCSWETDNSNFVADFLVRHEAPRNASILEYRKKGAAPARIHKDTHIYRAASQLVTKPPFGPPRRESFSPTFDQDTRLSSNAACNSQIALAACF